MSLQITFGNRRFALADGATMWGCSHDPYKAEPDTSMPVTQIRVGRPTLQGANLPSTENLFFHAPVVSKSHALVYQEKGQVYLMDTYSKHGTSVLKKGTFTPSVLVPGVSQEVNDGDVVSFGTARVKIDSEVHGPVRSVVQIDPISSTENRTSERQTPKETPTEQLTSSSDDLEQSDDPANVADPALIRSLNYSESVCNDSIYKADSGKQHDLSHMPICTVGVLGDVTYPQQFSKPAPAARSQIDHSCDWHNSNPAFKGPIETSHGTQDNPVNLEDGAQNSEDESPSEYNFTKTTPTTEPIYVSSDDEEETMMSEIGWKAPDQDIASTYGTDGSVAAEELSAAATDYDEGDVFDDVPSDVTEAVFSMTDVQYPHDKSPAENGSATPVVDAAVSQVSSNEELERFFTIGGPDWADDDDVSHFGSPSTQFADDMWSQPDYDYDEDSVSDDELGTKKSSFDCIVAAAMSELASECSDQDDAVAWLGHEGMSSREYSDYGSHVSWNSDLEDQEDSVYHSDSTGAPDYDYDEEDDVSDDGSNEESASTIPLLYWPPKDASPFPSSELLPKENVLYWPRKVASPFPSSELLPKEKEAVVDQETTGINGRQSTHLSMSEDEGILKDAAAAGDAVSTEVEEAADLESCGTDEYSDPDESMQDDWDAVSPLCDEADDSCASEYGMEDEEVDELFMGPYDLLHDLAKNNTEVDAPNSPIDHIPVIANDHSAGDQPLSPGVSSSEGYSVSDDAAAHCKEAWLNVEVPASALGSSTLGKRSASDSFGEAENSLRKRVQRDHQTHHWTPRLPATALGIVLGACATFVGLAALGASEGI